MASAAEMLQAILATRRAGAMQSWGLLPKAAELTPFLAVYLIFFTFLMPFLCCLYVWLCAAGEYSNMMGRLCHSAGAQCNQYKELQTAPLYAAPV